MPAGMTAGTAELARPTDTWSCRSAGSQTVARPGSHLAPSDGIKRWMEDMRLKC